MDRPQKIYLEKKITDLATKLRFNIFWYDSPKFLLNESELNDYFIKNKNLRMSEVESSFVQHTCECISIMTHGKTKTITYSKESKSQERS